MSSIFVITVMTAPVPRPFARSDGSVVTVPLKRDMRTWGWYAEAPRARGALAGNLTDLHEGAYRDAVIEEVREGVPGDVLSEEWFRFDPGAGGYVPAERPVDLAGTKCFFSGSAVADASILRFPTRAAPRPARFDVAGPGHVAFIDLAPYGQDSLIALLCENRASALVDLRPCPVFAKPRFRHKETVFWLYDNGVRYVEYAMEVFDFRDDPFRARLEARAMAGAVAPHLQRGLVVCIHDATSREKGWLDAMRRVMLHHPGCSAEMHPRALAGWLAPP